MLPLVGTGWQVTLAASQSGSQAHATQPPGPPAPRVPNDTTARQQPALRWPAPLVAAYAAAMADAASEHAMHQQQQQQPPSVAQGQPAGAPEQQPQAEKSQPANPHPHMYAANASPTMRRRSLVMLEAAGLLPPPGSVSRRGSTLGLPPSAPPPAKPTSAGPPMTKGQVASAHTLALLSALAALQQPYGGWPAGKEVRGVPYDECASQGWRFTTRPLPCPSAAAACGLHTHALACLRSCMRKRCARTAQACAHTAPPPAHAHIHSHTLRPLPCPISIARPRAGPVLGCD